MGLRDGIRRYGFRKWYERELLSSHGHLALSFLSALALLGAFEAASAFSDWPDRMVDAASIVASGAIGVWAIRRYLYLLMHAEHAANQAACAECGAYARFTLVDGAGGGRNAAVRVQCRQCAHQWAIED